MSFNSRLIPLVYTQLHFSNIIRKAAYNYSFSDSEFEPNNEFKFTETSLAFRYVIKENYLNFKGKRVFLDASYCFKVYQRFFCSFGWRL